PEPPAYGYAYLALVADAAGDAKESDAALAQASKLPDGDETAALTRAQLQFIHGDHSGAETAMRELIRRHPSNSDALAALGAALSSDSRYPEALGAYSRASAIARHDANLHYQAAMLLHALGRDREAREQCASALKIVPDNAAALGLMAELERGAAAR
ncbi:MAG TPA: tetratricopeptide repeat protein, partial [Candidatus Binataceae bacterium]|nr:tetratricopeptide repeat protein [Candidatus Binataceae bacterium]